MHIIFLHFEIIEIMFSMVKNILFFNSQFFMYVTDADCWLPMQHLSEAGFTYIIMLWNSTIQMGRVKRIWYLSPLRAAKVQASLRIRAVSPEPPLLAHTSRESRGTFRQKARSLAPLNGWACAVKICHDGMFEDTNSLDVAQILSFHYFVLLVS